MAEHEVPARASAAELPVRDEAAALAAVGQSADLARELLDTLLARLPAEVSALQALFAANDWRGLDEAVHRLRGATAYCAVPALDQALFALKEAAKAGDWEKIAEDLWRVEREASRLSSECV
jgi:two-component system sensor histidine kinase BarA